MKRFATFAVLFLSGSIAAAPAFAGIADWPLPVLVTGKKTLHVYSVSGVGGAGGGAFGTYFSCTSTDTAAMQVGVEVFGDGGGCASPPGCAPGNDAVATSLSVGSGATVMFGTCPADGILLTSDLAACFTLGSARILSTSRKLICTAFLADRLGTPPRTIVYLTIVKKTTQKGE